jgi:hypothetical protein
MGVAYFFCQALKQRRKVHPHSRYLLATALFLLPPIFGRLSPILPGLSLAGPQDFWKLGIGFQLANALTAAIAFGLAYHSGKHGRPFFLAGVLTLVGAILFETVGSMAWWESFYPKVADLPTLPVTLAAAVSGVIVAYAGWIAGRRSTLPPGAVPA